MKSIAFIFLIFLNLLCLTLSALPANPAANSPYRVRDFGAQGDGKTLDTVAVQWSIDACSRAGGGTVYFGPGTYLCGSLHLKSGVYLHLDAGAVLKGSPNDADYDKVEDLGFKNDSDRETSFFHFALIWAEQAERIGIMGQGTIDGNRTRRRGPKPIALKRCTYVDIQGIHLINAPNYNISLLGTDFVNIDGVTILNGFADGIDPDASRNVRISNCHIETMDDAIVPKASFSLGERRSCENITVTNCFLASEANCFKLGTESGGDFKHITVSNCVMTGIKGKDAATSGISLESVDGSHVDGVTISNISMYDVRAPIFIRLGSRLRDSAPSPGSIKNVLISNVVALNASSTSSITGIPGYFPEGITLSDIRLMYAGNGPASPVGTPVPELEKEYPSANMFKTLPCYGLYIRHVRGLVLSNLQLQYTDPYWRVPTWATWNKRPVNWSTPTGVPDPSEPGIPGPALLAEDVSDLDIHALQTRASSDGAPVLQFIDVRDAFLHGSRAPANTSVYLHVQGPRTGRIRLVDNMLRESKSPVRCTADVPQNAVLLDNKPVRVKR